MLFRAMMSKYSGITFDGSSPARNCARTHTGAAPGGVNRTTGGRRPIVVVMSEIQAARAFISAVHNVVAGAGCAPISVAAVPIAMSIAMAIRSRQAVASCWLLNTIVLAA